jgi:organic hydroperoxide reductase OsmC/OhrA
LKRLRRGGVDAAKFSELAEAAKGGCPISSALAGNVAISLEIVG